LLAGVEDNYCEFK